MKNDLPLLVMIFGPAVLGLGALVLGVYLLTSSPGRRGSRGGDSRGGDSRGGDPRGGDAPERPGDRGSEDDREGCRERDEERTGSIAVRIAAACCFLIAFGIGACYATVFIAG